VCAALEEARAHPRIKLVQLTVTERNGAARALYERCGFVAFGVEPFAVVVGNAYVSKAYMWCDVGGLGVGPG